MGIRESRIGHSGYDYTTNFGSKISHVTLNCIINRLSTSQKVMWENNLAAKCIYIFMF